MGSRTLYKAEVLAASFHVRRNPAESKPFRGPKVVNCGPSTSFYAIRSAAPLVDPTEACNGAAHCSRSQE